MEMRIERILAKAKFDFDRADSKEQINSLYKQLRSWNRIEHFFGEASSYDYYVELNNRFKKLRWDALDRLKKEVISNE